MNRDLNDLSAEIFGVSMLIIGLSNQLDNQHTDTLNINSMQSALFGVSQHLERIADDLDIMSE